MNELTVWFPSQISLRKSKHMVGSVVRGDLVDCLTELYHYFRDGGTPVPCVPVEPLRLSGDDEHLWIGLE